MIFREIPWEGVSPASKASVIDLYLVGCMTTLMNRMSLTELIFAVLIRSGPIFEPNGDFINCTNGNSAD